MIIKKLLFSILVLVINQGCFPGPDGDTEKLTGGYYLSGDIGMKNVHLGFEDKNEVGIGLVSEPIQDLGFNQEFILIRRKEAGQEYYIVKIMADGNHSTAEENVFGPLNKSEFRTKLRELGQGSLKFTRKFEK